MATLPDDDPCCNVQKPSFASVNDDVKDRDMCEEGRDDIMIMHLSMWWMFSASHGPQLPMFKLKQLMTHLTMIQM